MSDGKSGKDRPWRPKINSLANQRQAYCLNPLWRGHPNCTRCGVRQITIFADLPEADLLDAILRPVENMGFGTQGVLYHAGDPGRNVFTIRSGLVKLELVAPEGDVRIVRLLGPGDVAGLEALVTGKFHHNAIALTEIDCCQIPLTVLRALAERQPSLYQQLFARWQKYLENSEQALGELCSGPAVARLARLLLQLAGYDDRRGHFAFSRADLAAMVGVTTETVSRMMADFRRRKIFTRSRAGEVDYDRNALRRVLQVTVLPDA